MALPNRSTIILHDENASFQSKVTKAQPIAGADPTQRMVLGDISNKTKAPPPGKFDAGLVKKPTEESTAMDISVASERRVTRSMTRAAAESKGSDPTRPDHVDLMEEEIDDRMVLEEKKMDEAFMTNLALSRAKFPPHTNVNQDDPCILEEFGPEVMEYMRQSELRRQPSAHYMAKQQDINAKMREILIDWLVEVHLKFKLNHETLYLAINYLDRFLERRAVKRTKLQLVGCTSMLLASKYEEVHPPDIPDFVYFSDNAYTAEHILAMEGIMLNTLKFQLTAPTPYRFLQWFLRSLHAQATDDLQSMSLFLAELTLQEYKCLQYVPSLIASSALYLAMHLCDTGITWSPQLVATTGYSEAEMQQCTSDLYLMAARGDPKYRAVKKKYAKEKFGEVVTRIPLKPMAWMPEGFATEEAVPAVDVMVQ